MFTDENNDIRLLTSITNEDYNITKINDGGKPIIIPKLNLTHKFKTKYESPRTMATNDKILKNFEAMKN